MPSVAVGVGPFDLPAQFIPTDPPSGDWILATGLWDDSGIWDDSANWID